MKRRRSKFLTYAVAAAAGVVVLLLILIAVGYLVLPTKSAATVNITSTHYTILEGTNASGGFWFGPNTLSFADFNGYPTNLTAGSTFGIPFVLWNHDSANHTIYTVTVNAPFTFVSSNPLLPRPIQAGADNANFVFSVKVPNSPGASLALNVTINALIPG